MPRAGMFAWILLLAFQSATSQQDCDLSEVGTPKCAAPDGALQSSSLLQQASVRSHEQEKVGVADEAEAASIFNQTAGQGAQWTQEEALIVMAKLHQILKTPSSTASMLDITIGQYDCVTGFDDQRPQPCNGENGNDDGTANTDFPSAAKLLRLGFHDCTKYTDGSGGCDGCLKFYDQFRKYNDLSSGDKRQMSRADALKGTNNGLAMTADALECIYVDAGCPPRAPMLNQSLKDSGKSRADLWAFATLVGMDWAMATNNQACRGESTCGHVYTKTPNMPFSCEIRPSRFPKFKTGRRDCPAETQPTPNRNGFVKTMSWELRRGHRYRPYETTKDEQQPNPHGNAYDMRRYFRSAFGFNVREVVAIMGGHSLGDMHGPVSLFKYQWQFKQNRHLNNNYYRLLLNKPTFFVGMCDNPYFKVTGGPGGAPAQTYWAVRPIRKSVSGGPYMWFHMYRRCPACYHDESNSWVNVETEGSAVFRSTACCECNSQQEDQVAEGCVEDVAKDEIMMPVDMAMLVQFNRDDYGVPYGCKGFPSNWNRSNIVEQATGQQRHNLDFYKTVPDCAENTVTDFADRHNPNALSMADWVHIYAEDQNRWADDFYTVLEKMLSNGYGDSLQDGPDVLGIERATCPGSKRRTKTCQLPAV